MTDSLLMFVAVVGAGVTFLGSLGGLLIRHTNADAKTHQELRQSIADTRDAWSRELAEYKLLATKEFASVGHLQEVEARLVKHLDKIEDLITRALRNGEPR